uniref:Solute carrier family 13 member 1 n=1 Tax=Accipiter nisus TaxID=211598 RepID=A0A8B9MNZ1_9AVES
VAIFWLTEALPLAVSALLPAFMFPLFGIMESKEVASAYFKDFHLLLIGVICLATSIEKWNFHKRVALRMVMLVGVNPAWLMLGFMVSCAFLSMWLSNTSAAAMVMPIVEAVAQQIIRAEAEADALEMSCSNGSINPALELDGSKRKELFKLECNQNLQPAETGKKSREDKYSGIFKVMCLCVAYSATIGGLTTITGTSTNLIFAEHFNTRYPACQCINFGSWFILSIPITVIILLLSWVWLQWLFLGFESKYSTVILCPWLLVWLSLWMGQEFSKTRILDYSAQCEKSVSQMMIPIPLEYTRIILKQCMCARQKNSKILYILV